MAFERQGRRAPPRPRHFTISPHAEDRMWERSVVPEDLTAILRNNPLIEWQDAEYPLQQPSSESSGSSRLRMTGRGLQPRLLTAIIEEPNEDGFAIVVTVFDADQADRRRYRRHRRRQG